MNAFIFAMVAITFFYTMGFSIHLWKNKNKMGALSVGLLALGIVITPFFSFTRL
jgi:hypothetical protein